jgi:hypothetical protein
MMWQATYLDIVLLAYPATKIAVGERRCNTKFNIGFWTSKGERGGKTASWETKKGACSSIAYSWGRRRRAEIEKEEPRSKKAKVRGPYTN